MENRNRISSQQVNLNVTGSNWTTTRAIGRVYQTVDGAFRLSFNIRGSLSVATATLHVYIDGILSKNIANFKQAIAGCQTNSASYSVILQYIEAGTNDCVVKVSTSATDFVLSGDIELDGKPDLAE